MNHVIAATYYGVHYFIYMVQRLYLSMEYANEAVSSKEMTESLAFAMMVKLTFVNSKIKNATINRCKKIFGIGSTKMCRIINDGIKYGYLRKEGGAIIANSLRSEKTYHFHSDFEALTASRTVGKKAGANGKKEEVQCQYKLKEIIALIREAVLLNHISKQSECSDTINSLQAPKTSRQLKKAKKWQKRMRLLEDNTCERLSNRRIMDITHASLYHSRKLIRSIVGKRWALKRDYIITTDIDPENFDFSANRWFKKYGVRGYLFKLFYAPANRYIIACNVSRIYRYNCNLISFER